MRARVWLFALILILACGIVLEPSAVRADTSSPTYRVSRYGNLEFYFNNDLTAAGESYMNILRIYNSFGSEDVGMFGAGWASFFEVNLQVQDDGSILVHEYGGGANNVFSPTTASLVPQKKLRDEIMWAAGEVGQFGSDLDRRAYAGMLDDAEAEESTWDRLSQTGLLKPQQPAVGETFFSGRFGTEVITRVPEGYQRATQRTDGTYYEAFDLSGRLTRMWNKNREFVALAYQNGQLHDMLDNQGNRFAFNFNSDGLVTSVRDGRSNFASYQYHNSNLVLADVSGKITRYTYDARNRLVQVTLPNHAAMRFGYNGAGQLSSLTDADGTTVTYVYTTHTTAATRTDTVSATSKKPGSASSSTTSQYVYSLPDDTLVKEIDTAESASTQYTYDRDMDILTETTSAGTTTNTYDAMDRIVTKQSPTGTLTQWAYDPSTGRPVTITITTKGSTVTEHFQYDALGNIIHASNSTGQDLAIVHDASGRIASITGQTVELDLAYPNAYSLYPATITLAGVGSVHVTYAVDGSISAASSPGGDPVVAKVRSALIAITGLLKGAGVNLVTLPSGST